MCRILNTAVATQNWVLEPKLKPDVAAAGWSADGRRLMVASEKQVKIFDAGGSAARSAIPDRLAQAYAAIERQPGEDFGWHALARAVSESRGDGANPEADALLATARLGIEARFSTLGETVAGKSAAEWKGVMLPAAVRVAEACALGQWEDALALSLHAPGGDSFFLLARSEALTRLGRRADAEAATFEAWRALRRQHGGDEKLSSSTGEGVDLAPWANIKLTEDWAGGQNNNLTSLPAVIEQPGGRFH